MNTNFPSSTGLTIRPASFNDIPFIQQIAQATWPDAYGSILSGDQVEYMLGLLYSAPSLQQQMHDHHHFFLATLDAKPIGFASFSHVEKDVYKLQKLYVLPGIQKSGTGKVLLQTVLTTAKSLGATQLLLNVNRQNKAKTFYEKHGFSVLKEEDIDIGSGYFMNDFIMSKSLDSEV